MTWNGKKLAERIVDLMLIAMSGILLLLTAWGLGHVLVYDSFTIRGHSMEPTLHDGEKVWVPKLAMGPRIYTGYDFSSPELHSVRLPGFRRLRPGDIAVLNCPEGWERGRLGFRINYVYAKRCIGVPGDSISIVNGFYANHRLSGRRICPPDMQTVLSSEDDSLLAARGVYMKAGPGRCGMEGWTVKDFGPIWLPRKGDSVQVDSTALALYGRIMEYESGALPEEGSTYVFGRGYCFFGGDNVLDSRDSRYFGLVPEDFVIGKVAGHKMSREGRRLESVLRQSGRNRGELEKVLWHYRHDEEKLKAARWLIVNMPGHFSYEVTDGLRAVMDSIHTDPHTTVSPGGSSARGKVYDLDVITADYLIDNIDRAFDARNKRPWNRFLSEEEFYECILPYRNGTEPLENWRKTYSERFGWILDESYTGSDVVEAVKAVNDEVLGKRNFVYRSDLDLRDMSPLFLLDERVGDCTDICDFTVYLLRALGIPVCTDFSNKNLIHTWNVVKDTTGHWETVDFDERRGLVLNRGFSDGRTKGRVYRYCFKPTGNMFHRDVTFEYFGEKLVVMPVKGTGLVCLGGYSKTDTFSFIPIKRLGNLAFVRGIEQYYTYVPIINHAPCGYPIYADSTGRVHRLHPDKNRTQSITISRKHKVAPWLPANMNEGLGGTVEASSDHDFSSAIIIGRTSHTWTNYNYISISDTLPPFRFLRFSSAEGERLQMGEIRLFADHERKDTIKSEVRSASKAYAPKNAENMVVDNDELSYYLSADINANLILDLGSERKLSTIEWVPRNDDNFIRHGDEYVLLYQDGRRGWVSLETKAGTDSVLTFSSVPTNALLRLHDITRGVEENVFIMQEGKQVFLN